MPIVPPAPARFSTSTGWPQAALSFSPISRAAMSVALPAANGTTMRIGLTGKLAAACAGASGDPDDNTAAVSATSAHFVFFIHPPARILSTSEPPKLSRRRVQALAAFVRNHHQLAELHPGLPVARHYVR